MPDERAPRLVLEWVDPPKSPDANWWWGQVVAGMHRLVDVRVRFETVSRMRGAERSLIEFRAALELSWWHCYSVRERAVELLAVRAANRDAAGKMKKPSARCAARVLLEAKSPELTMAVACLVGLIDATVSHRNNHTHAFYVGIALELGHDIFDPEDLIVRDRKNVAGSDYNRAVVADAVRRKARECAEQLQSVIDCLSSLAEIGYPEMIKGTTNETLSITQAAFP